MIKIGRKFNRNLFSHVSVFLFDSVDRKAFEQKARVSRLAIIDDFRVFGFLDGKKVKLVEVASCE
jgi:hypothetical protein